MRSNAEPAACPPGKAFYGRAVVELKDDDREIELEGILVRQFPDPGRFDYLEDADDYMDSLPWLVIPEGEGEAYRAADKSVYLYHSLGETRELWEEDLPTTKELREAFDAVMDTKPRNRQPAFKAIKQLILDAINGAPVTIDPWANTDTWEGRANILARDLGESQRREARANRSAEEMWGDLEDTRDMLRRSEAELADKYRLVETLTQRVHALTHQLNQT